MPVVKKKKETAGSTEAQKLAAAAPPQAQKDEDGLCAPTAGSSSRGSGARPREDAISVTKPAPEAPALSSPAEVPKAPEPPASSAAATSPILTPCAVSSPVHHAAGPAAWSQAVAASEEGKQAAGLAAVAPDLAVKDAEAAEERCRVAEAGLKTLCDQQVAEARQCEVRDEEMKAQEAAVADRDAELEQRPRKALQDLYGRGLKEPLVTAEEGPAELLPQLVTALEGVVLGADPMVEGEARALSASAMMRVFSHLHLRDPNFDFGALLQPVDLEHCTAAAEAMKDQVESLLRKFLAIDPAPMADGAADPPAATDGTCDGDVVDDGALLAGDGSAQG
nr:neuromodulin-like [Aegilops tauschii subsp. strangulata]